MGKKLLLTILLLLFGITEVFAATEFIVTVKSSGGDYTTLQSAETGIQNDLTSATIKVFSISAYTTPTLVAGDTVLGQASTATGVVVLVNAARTQVLIKTIAVAAFQSGEVVQKTTDAGVTVTLSNAGDSPIIGIACYSSAAPDGAATIDGSVSSATNYIKIYTPTSERHLGVYNTSKYRIETTNNTIPLVVKDPFVRVDGLQFYLQSSNAANPRIVQFYATGGTVGEVANNVVYFTNNIIRGHTNSTQTGFEGVQIYQAGSGTSNAYVYNNLIYDIVSSGDAAETGLDVNDSAFNFYIYNNTFVGIGARGITAGASTTKTMRNNLFSGSGTIDINGTVNDTSGNNSTTRASIGYTCSPGACSGDRTSQTFTFVNSGASDWHLASTDAGARNYGAELSGTFTTDIDGQTRPGESVWDIGMDEVFPRTLRSNSGEGWE